MYIPTSRVKNAPKVQHGLLTYLLCSDHHVHVLHMFFFCFFSLSVFSYTVLCELRLFIVSEFGFGVWNPTTAPATMEYLPILLGKYPHIYFLVNIQVVRFLPRDAMLSAVYAVVVCLSVCLCVCVCHTPVLYQNG